MAVGKEVMGTLAVAFAGGEVAALTTRVVLRTTVAVSVAVTAVSLPVVAAVAAVEVGVGGDGGEEGPEIGSCGGERSGGSLSEY